MQKLLDIAIAYAKRGWPVFPCRPDKRPYTNHGFKDATTAESLIRKWWTRWPDAGIGLDCGSARLVVIDCDVKSGADGISAFEALEVDHSGALHSQTPSGGLHIVFRDTTEGQIHNSASKLAPGVDIRANGGYILLPPSTAGGGDYVALDDWDRVPAPVPDILVSMLTIADAEPPPPSTPSHSTPRAYGAAALAAEIRNVMTSSDGQRNETLNRASFALGQLVAGGELAEPTVVQALTAAALAVGLTEKETAATIRSGLQAGSQQPRTAPVVTKSLSLAAQTVATGDSDAHQSPPITAQQDTGLSPQIPKLGKIKHTLALGETGDGELLASMYSDMLAYDHTEKQWYSWSGHAWKKDVMSITSNLVAYQVAAQYLQGAADLQAIGDDRGATAMTQRATSLRQRNRINNVLDRAKSQRALALTGEEWDRDPWLLGVQNGVVNLQSGDLQHGKPRDYIRKASPTTWQGIDTPAPRWEQFLEEIFANDREIIEFVQRLLGYGITGLAVEHVLPVLWGEGRNGKGTLLETIGYVLGDDLATPTDANTLMAATNSNSGLQPFVYDLRGSRIVWASESNEGRRLDAALVKKLTGGDTIKTRTLHSLPVRFSPTYLILLLTNHKPHINADDQAIWDRINLVPFTKRFVDAPQGSNEYYRDKNLSQRLRQEGAGILAWLVRGCLAWQQTGLNPPRSVKAATEDYRAEEDTLGLFISERLIFQEGAVVKASDLFDAYKIWGTDNNLYILTGTRFGVKIKRKLERMGVTKNRRNDGFIYDGVGLSV